MRIRRALSPAALGAALLAASAAIAQDGAEPSAYERAPARAEVFLRGRAGSLGSSADAGDGYTCCRLSGS